ncbi:MAG: YXWGXW repeat-containing protein, partial [Zavarzinella sp.]|nr:YXWGXW repeat-containing protein [Zavarzinella sp.]
MTIPRLPWRALALAGLFLASVAIAQPPPPPAPTPASGAPEGAEELTRGPIHEAFAQPTVFNPQAGPIAAKAPPEAIDELPPDEKPEGENVAWIPGYWQWDDEAKNFIWVSGFWRSIPPGQTWVPGYWTQVSDGYQWVSGFWAPERATEVEYLPPPPESLEAGPSTEPAAEGQIWIPGVWMWQETRYVWRPGFWTAGNPDWVWVPAHYVWTPSGFVFVDGFWDFPLFNRGLLFAPVVFTHFRPGLVFRPAVVIDPRMLVVSLFVRPRFHHYFFGDFYADTYSRAGIYPWWAFHASRYGFDPLFAQTNFVFSRRDPQWANQVREAFLFRRDNEAARPPRTFRQYSEWARRGQGEAAQRIALAAPLTEVARNRDFPTQLVRVDERQSQVIRNSINQIHQFRDQRVKIERDAARDLRPGTDAKAPARRTAPARVRLPEAPKLGPTPTTKGPGVTTPPRKGETTRTPGAPPEAPRVPTPGPKEPPTPAPKGKPRTLPDPEDVLRREPGTTPRPAPKGNIGEVLPPGSRTPPTRKEGPGEPPAKKERPRAEPPERPGTPPAGTPKREPPETTPPKREPPAATPPKREPPETTPPKREPPAATPPKREEPPPAKKEPPKKKDG